MYEKEDHSFIIIVMLYDRARSNYNKNIKERSDHGLCPWVWSYPSVNSMYLLGEFPPPRIGESPTENQKKQ